MDEIFGILMEQIVLFLFYMIVGVLLVKTHILAENTLETLSRFVMKLALPVMILSTPLAVWIGSLWCSHCRCWGLQWCFTCARS